MHYYGIICFTYPHFCFMNTLVCWEIWLCWLAHTLWRTDGVDWRANRLALGLASPHTSHSCQGTARSAPVSGQHPLTAQLSLWAQKKNNNRHITPVSGKYSYSWEDNKFKLIVFIHLSKEVTRLSPSLTQSILIKANLSSHFLKCTLHWSLL